MAFTPTYTRNNTLYVESYYSTCIVCRTASLLLPPTQGPRGLVFTQEAHYSCWLPRQMLVIELLPGAATTPGTTDMDSTRGKGLTVTKPGG